MKLSPTLTTTDNALRAGVLAGLWAGFVSSAPGVVHAVGTGRGIWEPVRLISTLVGLPAGCSFAPAPVAAGGLIHVTLSAVYGALYASAAPPAARMRLRWGVGYGLLLHVVNLRLVTRARRFRRLRDETSEPVELMAHVLYGAALAAALRGLPEQALPLQARTGGVSRLIVPEHVRLADLDHEPGAT